MLKTIDVKNHCVKTIETIVLKTIDVKNHCVKTIVLKTIVF